jgi:hypothetical protein
MRFEVTVALPEIMSRDLPGRSEENNKHITPSRDFIPGTLE